MTTRLKKILMFSMMIACVIITQIIYAADPVRYATKIIVINNTHDTITFRTKYNVVPFLQKEYKNAGTSRYSDWYTGEKEYTVESKSIASNTVVIYDSEFTVTKNYRPAGIIPARMKTLSSTPNWFFDFITTDSHHYDSFCLENHWDFSAGYWRKGSFYSRNEPISQVHYNIYMWDPAKNPTNNAPWRSCNFAPESCENIQPSHISPWLTENESSQTAVVPPIIILITDRTENPNAQPQMLEHFQCKKNAGAGKQEEYNCWLPDVLTRDELNSDYHNNNGIKPSENKSGKNPMMFMPIRIVEGNSILTKLV